MTQLATILIPIFICVVLPVAIIWIVARARTENRKIMSDTVLAALDKNPNINAEEILKSMNIAKTRKKEQDPIDNLRTGMITLAMGAGMMVLPLITDIDTDLMIPGIVLAAVGIGYTAAYFVGKNKVQE